MGGSAEFCVQHSLPCHNYYILHTIFDISSGGNVKLRLVRNRCGIEAVWLVLQDLVAIAIATRTLLLIIKTLEGTRNSLANGHGDAGYQVC